MAGETAIGDYTEVVLFLATAGVVVPIFRRFRLSPVLAFLGAGVVLGPFGLGALQGELPWLRYVTMKSSASMEQLAEFGVVFLLFAIGLELSWERLWTMRRFVFGLGGSQVVVCAAVIAGAAMLLGQPPMAAVLLGAALGLSSTAVVMPLLAERNRQFSRAGRATFSVLLLQDLAVAPILVTIAVLGGDRGEGFSPKLLLAFAAAALGLLVLVVLGRLVLRPMMRSVVSADSEELFVAASLLIVVGAGLVAAVSGLSMALGAFVAGLLLAETEYRKDIEATVAPFKGLLLGLFFVSIGIGLDLSLLAARPALIAALLVGLMLLNGFIVFGLARLFGLRAAAAVETALLLAGAGEFAFVILHSAAGEGLVDRAVVQTVLVSATLSMFCLPGLATIGAALGRPAGVAAGQPMTDPLRSARSKVLIVGYGRVGKAVADMLTRQAIPWIALERAPRLVSARQGRGHEVILGDAAGPDVLDRLGLDGALAMVVTLASAEAAEAAVVTARALAPDLGIVARARGAEETGRLYRLGASDVVPEEIEASLRLSEALLLRIGTPPDAVAGAIAQRRDAFRVQADRAAAIRKVRARRLVDVVRRIVSTGSRRGGE
ncbi:cation:proton antiporter [Reyranella sp.]|uniref:cation:proton antiporter domain-containing protein n=1 Tax=Reyranella sp. TaxID=1929291 RepID=UPI003BAD3AC2